MSFHATNALPEDTLIPPKFRVPGVASPNRYRLDLTIIPDKDTFTGAVDINLSFLRASKELWLNANQLEIREAQLVAGMESLPAKIISTPKDYVGFLLNHPVGPGPTRLHVVYEGKISRKDMQGIFQVKEGNSWYVYSQFEELYARRAFPCFDEPNYKVPWQLTLHTKKEHAALSNAPIVSEVVENDGMKTVKFAETKPLPSYLVALAVGTFDFVNAGIVGKKNTQVRIVVPHGRTVEAQYAVESTSTILGLLEKYFGIPYPYEKLDEVAIPLAGYAMEHPGLVTYGAQIILSKPERDTLERKRSYASVAAHELAHMWFGDLVTAAWWDDIWLNEGFASWMANKILNQYRPEWKMNISELNAAEGAMGMDGMVSARKVRQPIGSNDDIANAFDGITYNKGSALLNMFENYMGLEHFQEGIRRYLTQYAWKNATSTEFLAALGGANQSIATAFSSFLDQAGVPLLSVQLDCGGGRTQLDLSQERFLPMGSKGSADQTWQIPVCIRHSAGKTSARECVLLKGKSGKISLPDVDGCSGWVFANAGAGGYYRVLYKGDLLSRILKGEAEVLDLPEKVALIGNLAVIVDSGKMPLGEALTLVSGLAKDPAREVVTKTMWISTGLEEKIVPETLLPKYRRYLLDLYGEREYKLGWKAKPDEDDDTRLLRPGILSVVANEAEDMVLVDQAKRLAVQWLDNRQAIDPDMVDVVLYTAARHGDRALFDRFRTEAKKEKDERQRQELLSALGSFRDPNIIDIALPIVLTDEFDIRESLSILFGPTQSSKTRDLAFNFVKENWDALVAKLPTDYGAFLPYVAAGYSDEKHRAEVESFFSGRSTKYTGGPRILAQVLEGINLQGAYKNAHRASVVTFLGQYGNRAS